MGSEYKSEHLFTMAPLKGKMLLLILVIAFCPVLTSSMDKVRLPHHVIKHLKVKDHKVPIPKKMIPSVKVTIQTKKISELYGTPQFCNRLKFLLSQKRMTLQMLNKYIAQLEAKKILKKSDIEVEEILYEQKTFQILGQELNETEQLVINSLDWLEDVIHGNYHDIINLRESAKARLDTLQEAALREQQEYKTIMDTEEKMKQFNHSEVEGIIDQILRDVAKAANDLEKTLDNHVFENAMEDPDRKKEGKIETVIRLEDGDGEHAKPQGGASNKTTSSDNSAGSSVIKLVDSQDNQFVLAKGKDTTIPHEDHHLLQDVVLLMISCFLLGAVCSLVGLPTMFGHIVSGVILGPSGFNFLKSLVQLETLGQFGVFFILFAVGLEFSPTRIKKVLKVATLGTTLQMLIMIGCGVGLGHLWDASTSEAVFVAACLSLSSTPLIVKFLNPGASSDDAEAPSNTDYGTTLLGILIMQDVYLGLLMAVLPNMAQKLPAAGDESMGMMYGKIVLQLLSALCIVMTISVVLSKFVIGRFYKLLKQYTSREVVLLATVAFAFSMLTLTDRLHISMELGCFIAGAIISAQSVNLAHDIETLTRPLTDFLACIFFSSIGLHVFPTFMAYEMSILTTLTLATISAKYVFSLIVLSCIVKKSRNVKWMVSAGLAQVSEFSFVLGSKARKLNLISREVYLLILGITTLSLLAAPVLWQFTLWQLRIRHSKRSRSSPSVGSGDETLPLVSPHPQSPPLEPCDDPPLGRVASRSLPGTPPLKHRGGNNSS